jgi:hypothetical protein
MRARKCLHKILLKKSQKTRKNSFTSNFQPQIDNFQVGHTQINQNKQTRHQTLQITYKQKNIMNFFLKHTNYKQNEHKKQKHF